MTASFLSAELTNLIQESKRKHSDLRQAAEKSLEELKGLKGSLDPQVTTALSQSPTFVNPFVIACGTKNIKFSSIAVVCLQRLITTHALPSSKLAPVLQGLREAITTTLEIQLRILQALPPLLQQYAADIKGELLVTALNICFVLQSSKNAIVNNTSAATLQQLVVSVFDHVVAEDSKLMYNRIFVHTKATFTDIERTESASPEEDTVGEAPTADGKVKLRGAAMDAYRVLNDICLMTEGQRSEYLRFTGLSQTFGFEMIESVLVNHSNVFLTHPEQLHLLRLRIMPLIISILKTNSNFATSARVMRILQTILRKHLHLLDRECGVTFEIMIHQLDQSSALWQRALCMEVFRGAFSEPGLFRRIYGLYDAKGKPVLKDLTGAFVRISTENPVVIGLGHASTLPVANPYATAGPGTDQALLEASGVAGLISSGSMSDTCNTGISMQWSSMRVPCIDQLDKMEAPSIPESYLYGLTLACITSLSEGLAKFILPLTVPTTRPKKAQRSAASTRESTAPTTDEEAGFQGVERATSFKKNPVSVNPLLLEDHPLHSEVKICAQLIEECWPAILATCSTFMTAALDSEYYHGLVRAFQKFTHVAGLLQLDTPRDAFLTTLGKSAVPPNIFSASLNTGAPKSQLLQPQNPSSASSIFNNARGLLSVESLVSQDAVIGERSRQQSVDTSVAALNTRNLLCLRALLNLGIALGPTLGASWRILLETLQQADLVLFSTSKAAGKVSLAGKGSDPVADREATQLVANFASEVRSVEMAATRLIESTVDFPSRAFVKVVHAICDLLNMAEPAAPDLDSRPSSASSNQRPRTPRHHRFLNTSMSSSAGSAQENQFALAKLGELASANIERLLGQHPQFSGWDIIIGELVNALELPTGIPAVRHRAAHILISFITDCSTAALGIEDMEAKGIVQSRLMEALQSALYPLQQEERGTSVSSHGTDIEIHKSILEGLKHILEACGESLVSGWDVTFYIIDSIFEKRIRDNASGLALRPKARSSKLIRSSFNSLQLICSDYLACLDNSCFLLLVDTLFEFCSQIEDLNIALTTVTYFWALSAHLSKKSRSLSIHPDIVDEFGEKKLVETASDPNHDASDASLWMLLLFRLTGVASDERLEVRKSAVQTLLRIFDAYSDSLNPEAWIVCIKFVIFRLLSTLEDRLQEVYKKDAGVDVDEHAAWNETAVVVLTGISDLLAIHTEAIAKHEDFNNTWQKLLDHFTVFLDLHALDINTAIFKALSKVLSSTETLNVFGKQTVTHAWKLWSAGLPLAREARQHLKTYDNQPCFTAYILALSAVYRLMQAYLTVSHVERMLELLEQALVSASVGTYSKDVEYLTPLQSNVLEALKMIRTDLPGAPSAMTSRLAAIVSLPFGDTTTVTSSARPQRTYIAMSRLCMEVLQDLVLQNASNSEIYSKEAFATALTALAKPITLKYQFSITTKAIQPWRVATTSAVEILVNCLPHVDVMQIPVKQKQQIWEIVVTIATGIIAADLRGPSAAVNIAGDEEFDIMSFRKLRDCVIPALGASYVPEWTRQAYGRGLFTTSIIHSPAPEDEALIAIAMNCESSTNGHRNNNGIDDEAIASYNHDDKGRYVSMLKPRLGRTIDHPPTPRQRMAYVCLCEMVSLLAIPREVIFEAEVTMAESCMSTALKTSAVPQSISYDSLADFRTRLASATVHFFVIRAGFTLRAYVSDTPLRGAMPQPLSQRRELAAILDALVSLQGAKEFNSSSSRGDVDKNYRANGEQYSRRNNMELNQLGQLYPLIVQVATVAGKARDNKTLGLASQALAVMGMKM